MKLRASALLALLLPVLLGAPPLPAATLAPSAGRFEVSQDGKTMPVWYYLPEAAVADAPILIAMHGVNRDADRYRDEWLPHARRYGFILVAPEFSNAPFPGSDGYTLGGGGAFGFIEPVFDAIKAATGNRSERYHLFGHSAGAQFVHRFLYFVPESRAENAVAANAGWWTLPDLKVDFPYGLRGSDVDEAALKKALRRPLTILLGMADTHTEDPNLRRTPEALAQGPHRFARGQNFFATAQREAAALKVPIGWQLATAPGVAHSNKGMAAFAVTHLFGPPVISGRDPARVRVLFGGDTSGGESYQEEYAKTGGVNIITEKGYEHGVGQLKRLLGAVDFRVINRKRPSVSNPSSATTNSPVANRALSPNRTVGD